MHHKPASPQALCMICMIVPDRGPGTESASNADRSRALRCHVHGTPLEKSPPDSCATANRARERLSQLGFPVLPQLHLTAGDYPEGDPAEAADDWAGRLDLAGLAEAEACLDEVLAARDASERAMYSSPFAELQQQQQSLPGEPQMRCACGDLSRFPAAAKN